MSEVLIEKSCGKEGPIPTEWRAVIKSVADAIVFGKPFPNSQNISITDYPADISEINQSNIDDYPDDIGVLDEQTWKTSVYVWTGDRWEILLDLSTFCGETSDLVLHGQMFEEGAGFLFKPGLIYVP